MISKIVQRIIEKDQVATKSLIRGIINKSAYARSINKEVENIYGEGVSEKAIVMALGRLENKIGVKDNFDFKIDNFKIYPNLVECFCEVNSASVLKELYEQIMGQNKMGNFVIFSQSLSEVCLIMEDTFLDKINDFGVTVLSDLVGVSLKFSDKYLEVPGFVFYLTRLLYYENINLIELISTPTEVTLLIAKKDVDKVMRQLSIYL